MRTVPFKQVDVFTRVPFMGNPVAVVFDATLAVQQMQRIARWTNLSETTFVLPAMSDAADYRLRIFTPTAELPFAGHPTIGSAHALLEAGLITAPRGNLVQECGVGLVRLAVDHDREGERWISFELPPPTTTLLSIEQVVELEEILGCAVRREAAPRLIDVGARWIVAELSTAQAVLAVRPDFQRMALQDRRAKATGVVVFGGHDADAPGRIEVRAFAPAHGIDEDPVCGSGNGCVAAFIRDTGQLSRFGSAFVASQGTAVGRAGMLRIAVDGPRILVGGMSVTCIDGHLSV